MNNPDRYAIVDGNLVSRDKALLPVTDIGILRGYSVFDYTRSYSMVPFMLKEHAARLRNSARLVGIKCPYSVKELCEMTDMLVKKNGVPDRGIRFVLTGGDAAGLSPAPDSKPRLFILTENLVAPNPNWFTKGGKLLVHAIRRDLPSAKTTGYLHAVRLNKERIRQKACDILYVVDGIVRECAISNFFIVKKGKIITPKSNLLPGVTRNIVLKLARKKFGTKNVLERDISFDELKVADEAFVTATNKEVVPITKVANVVIGIGLPGEVTATLHDEYAKFTKKNTKQRN